MQAHARPPSAPGPKPAAAAPAAGLPAALPPQQLPAAPGIAALPSYSPAHTTTAALPSAAAMPWAAGVADSSVSLVAHLQPQYAAQLATGLPAGYQMPLGVAVSAPSYTASAAGMGYVAGIERSPTSYSSAVSMGGPAAASFSSAALPTALHAGLGSVPSTEAEGTEAVERSGGSLLNWSRPPGRKPAGGSSPGSRGGSAGVRPGWTPQAAEGPGASEHADEQNSGRGGGIRSFLRSAKSSPSSSARGSRSGAAGGSARSQSQLAAVVNAEGPLPQASPAAAGYNSDLQSSVRNWQRQQGGDEACEASGQSSSQQEGLAVDGCSDSLLQWRLPPRTGSGRQTSTSQHAPPAASGASPPRIGSASLRRTLSNFKQKLFGGGDAPAAEPPKQAEPGVAAAQQQRQHGAGHEWSIAAVRGQPPASSILDAPGTIGSASRPGLTVAVPADGTQSSEQLDSPESPGKAAERLNRLRQMADRRRVWSAPLHAPEQAGSSTPDGSGGGDGMPAPATGGEAAGSAAGQRPPSGSTGPRPGLQALKARARTARLMSSGSITPGLASSSLYSMEAVNDVFGPDQPVPSSPWSPLKVTPASGSPPKVRERCLVG